MADWSSTVGDVMEKCVLTVKFPTNQHMMGWIKHEQVNFPDKSRLQNAEMCPGLL